MHASIVDLAPGPLTAELEMGKQGALLVMPNETGDGRDADPALFPALDLNRFPARDSEPF